MKKVREDLYIGSMEDAQMYVSGERHGVTHLLSLEKVHVKKRKKTQQLSKLQQVLLELQYHDPVYDQVASELASKCGPAAADRPPIVKTLPLKDVVEEDLLHPLDSCLDFIDHGREQGIVLVHCGAGISRSGAVVTAYLMRKENLSLDDALKSLRKSSPQVSPNDGFMDQLRDFQRNQADKVCEESGSKRVKV